MERLIAYQILLKYYQEGTYLNLALNSRFNLEQLDYKSKALITRLVYGTVQYQLNLEYQLGLLLEKKKLKLKAKIILYLAIYQLYYLDKLPIYAIINESVGIAKKEDKYLAGFINAILRAYVKQGKRSFEGLDCLERLSIETSHPLWLVKMLEKQYGLKTCKEILYANNEIPELSSRYNSLKISKEELLKDPTLTSGNLSKDAIIFKKGNIAHSRYYQEGLVTIQDQSSQLVARLLNPREDDYVLDMCCAPGSKTSHLSALMNNRGKIEAYDLYEHKIELVKSNLNRLGCKNVEVHVGDSTRLPYPSQSFDKILLDAPCTGFGVFARKPEIKYHDSNAMDQIIDIQRKLLENGYILLKNNGKMVYSTCTINKKENTLLIKEFLKKHDDMILLEEKQILPQDYHSDGFYMCLLEKRKV